MIINNIRVSLHTIRSAKWHSFLTMLGIIIGVASVITTVSLGEGVKGQIAGQPDEERAESISIRPSTGYSRDNAGNITGLNFFNNIATTLSEDDLSTVNKIESVESAAPLATVSGVAEYNDSYLNSGFVVGTNAFLPQLLDKEVQFGSFFSVGEEGRRVAVLGKLAAQELFEENVPIGKSFIFRGEEFIVRGIFEDFGDNPFSVESSFNRAIFIPYIAGQTVSDGNAQIFEIIAQPTEPELLEDTKAAIHEALLVEYGGQEAFVVMTSSESDVFVDSLLTLLTAMVAGIAAISLFVGGVGIMNIMLVSVTERTHEIGIRKAVGATNRQILMQFLVEAIVLSVIGSIIGVLTALLINYLVRIFTSLAPVIDVQIIGLSVLVALVVGIVFGVAPALKAAKKSPISALRYE